MPNPVDSIIRALRWFLVEDTAILVNAGRDSAREKLRALLLKQDGKPAIYTSRVPQGADKYAGGLAMTLSVISERSIDALTGPVDLVNEIVAVEIWSKDLHNKMRMETASSELDKCLHVFPRNLTGGNEANVWTVPPDDTMRIDAILKENRFDDEDPPADASDSWTFLHSHTFSISRARAI